MKNLNTTTAAIAAGIIAILAGTAQANTPTFDVLYTFNGENEFDFFGSSVSGAGDVNGDGYADLIVGAFGDDNNGTSSGSARVLSGIDGTELYTFNGVIAGDDFGVSVSGAGDVNGDGFADLIVGAPEYFNNGNDSGSVRVLSGNGGGVLDTFNGDSAFDNFGISVSGAGDVNGDGYADLIVGANGDDNNGDDSGSARVLSGNGGSVLYTFNGDSAGDLFGASVSGAGDVNGDGYADLIVGAWGDDNNGFDSGSARVLSGIDGTELYTFNGNSQNDEFGWSVSGAGDVNGDGFADLIVGAWFYYNIGTHSGSARVLSGIDGSELFEFNGDGLGRSVSGAGDVNNDGYADLIVGAWGDDNNGSDAGSAFIYSGIDGSLLSVLDGLAANDGFGGSVSGAGDVNGDGIDDFIVGAPRGGANNGGYAVVYAGVEGPCFLTYDRISDRTVEIFDLLGYFNDLTDSQTSTDVRDYITGFKACAN